MSYISELKGRIRSELKSLGYNSRRVSVRERPGGWSYSISLTIKDAEVDAEAVWEIANRSTSVDRCEASGEILSGGNTFVSVNTFRGDL